MILETSILMATLTAAPFVAALTVAPADRLAMADRLFNRGEYAAARTEYAALEGEKEISPELLAFRRLFCAHQLGEKAAVRKDGEEFLRRYPAAKDAPEVRYFRALAAEGEDRLRELKALDADSTPPSRRASVLCDIGRLTEDASAFERAQKVDPKGPLAAYARYYHAILFAKSANAAERKQAIEELLDVAFGVDKSIGENALYSAARLTFSEKRYGEAVSLAKQYLRKFPDAKERIRELRSIAAMSEYNSGKYSSAIEFCGEEQGEEFDMVRALAYDRFGDRAKGIEAAKLYLERYPQGTHRRDIDLILSHAEFSEAEKSGDVRKMVEAARRGSELSSSAGDRLRYAWTLEKAGETGKAEREYEAVAAAFPKTAEAADALYRRGLSLIRRQQWSAAEPAFAEALSIDSFPADRRGVAAYWRAVACLKLGHTVKSEAYFKEALAAKLPPDEEREAKLSLADIAYEAGRADEALKAYAALVKGGAAERMNASKTYAIGRLLEPEAAKLCAEALVRSSSAEWRQSGYALLGDVEEKLGSSAAAAAAWTKALAEECTTESVGSAALKLGLHETASGAVESAEKHLAQAIKLNRRDSEARAQAYLALAKCALARKDEESARKYATVVVTLFEKTTVAAEAGEILRKYAK